MKNLLKAEWFKLLKSSGFKILCLCNAASLPVAAIFVFQGSKGTGYEAFVTALTYTFHHNIIGYMFAAIFVCKEFSDRTFGAALSCGVSRRKVFGAKIIVFLAGLLLLFLIYAGAATFIFSIVNGFGREFSINIILMLLCGLLGCIVTGLVMLSVAVMVKKTAVTVGLGIAITYCLLLGKTYYLQGGVFPFIKYTYFYQIEQLRFWGNDFSPEIFSAVLLLTAVFALAMAGFIFEKSELK